jgi:hypothetical protein
MLLFCNLCDKSFYFDDLPTDISFTGTRSYTNCTGGLHLRVIDYKNRNQDYCLLSAEPLMSKLLTMMGRLLFDKERE